MPTTLYLAHILLTNNIAGPTMKTGSEFFGRKTGALCQRLENNDWCASLQQQSQTFEAFNWFLLAITGLQRAEGGEAAAELGNGCISTADYSTGTHLSALLQ